MSDVVAGRNPVMEALVRRADEVEKILVQRGSTSPVLRRIASDARATGINVQYVPRQKLDQHARGTPHQGVVALTTPIPFQDLEEMLTAIGATIDEVTNRRPFILVLDGVQDPHNFGAILRSAAAAGVDGLVTPTTGSAPLNTAAVKSSAGTAGIVPIARTHKLGEALVQLKERGYWVVGLGSEGEETIWTVDWQRPVVLVVGSEGRGMSGSVRQACDHVVRIPMDRGIESLNASVATGITLFAARHARSKAP